MNSAYFAPNDGSILLRSVFLDGKTNYNHIEREKDVLNLISSYPGPSFVHYVFDVDRGLRKDKTLNNKIEAYVKKKRYRKMIIPDIIWFNKNVGQVLLGHFVADNKKVTTAIKFNANGKVVLDEQTMMTLSTLNPMVAPSSNFLAVMYPLIPPSKKAAAIWKKLRK